jgi:hypothetical protein
MDESLRQATLGAGNIQAPASPLGSFPELASLYQSSFQLPVAAGAGAALTNQRPANSGRTEGQTGQEELPESKES